MVLSNRSSVVKRGCHIPFLFSKWIIRNDKSLNSISHSAMFFTVIASAKACGADAKNIAVASVASAKP